MPGASSSSTPLMSLSAVVLDTETTGLDANSARIIQIGAVRIVLGALHDDDCIDVLVNPEQPVPPESTQVHGIHTEDVREAGTFAEVSGDFETFLQDRVIIGHSVGYDLAILKREYSRSKLIWKRPRSLDTMVLAQIVNPMLANYSIEAVANWLGIEVEGRHTALGDAMTTARLFLALVPLLRSKGIRTLAEAERSSRALGDVLHRHENAGWLDPAMDPAIPATDIASKVARIDSFPFRHRVRDVMSAPPVFAKSDLSPHELGQLLTVKDISSVYVKAGPTQQDIGIVTERDLMRVLTSPDRPKATAEQIMSAPLKSVSENAYIYQAITLMRQLGVRHLGVTDDNDELVGALSSGDLMRQRAVDAVLLGDELASAQSVASLAAIWARLPLVARKLFDEQILSYDIVSIIAEELCSVTKRAAEIAEARMLEQGHGEPPVSYCLLVLGSGGRGESLLSPDQDNAIIFQSGQPGGPEDRWFEQLGKHISDILNDIGVPYCTGGVMASSAKWRHSIEGWKAIIDGWIEKSDPADLVYVDIFYDFRGVHGDRKLAQSISHYAQTQAKNSPAFIETLSQMTAKAQPPLGLLGNIRSNKGLLEIKRNTLLNIVGGARTLALEHGVTQRSTRQRLESVQQKRSHLKERLDNVMEAHKVLLGEVLEQQLGDIERGIPPSYKIELKRLPKRRKDQLRWALKQVNTMNSLLGDGV